jgi:hypothetical protein
MTSAENLSIPKHVAKKNLAEYIATAKLGFPFEGISWSQISWDITLFTPKRGQGKKRCIVHFHTRTIKDRRATTTPLHPKFLDFAKALFSTTMSIKMLSSPQRLVYALQYIEKALIDQSIEPCITNLTNDVLDGLATRAEQDFERPWDILNTVQKIVNVIENRQLSIESLCWVNPIPFGNPPRNDRTSQEHDKTIKLPSIQAICELGAIHNESLAINDKVTTCFVALALFAPSRSCEVLTLPVNCVTSGESREGPVMGIAWHPAKGGLPLTKYAASKESEILALDAIEYLTNLGETARVAAKWYRENPGKLYLPQPFEHLRNQPLTLREASQIIGRERDIPSCRAVEFGLKTTHTFTRDPTRAWRKRGTLTPLYFFEGLEKWALSRLPPTFPELDQETELYWDEGLFVLPQNSLRPGAAIIYNVPDTFSSSALNNQMGGFSNNSIFMRNNKRDSAGNPYKVTTHQIRHLLNTLAESKYLSQELIAFWSGRKSAAQNEWYNHLPQEAYIEAYVKLGEEGPDLEVHGPLVEKAAAVARNNLISYEEAMKIELGSIQATEHGLCRHQFSLTPCPKDKNCSGCGEFAFMKGDAKSRKSASVQLTIFINAVSQCQKGVSENSPGAARWLAFNQEKLARWQMIMDIHNDEGIPDGTLISLPPPKNSQSKTSLAIQAEKLNTQIPVKKFSADGDDDSFDGKLLDDLDFF